MPTMVVISRAKISGIDEQELHRHLLRVQRDEDDHEDDQDTEAPGPPVGPLAPGLKIMSVGHEADSISRYLRSLR
jgi:hypothetical protein